MSKEPEIYVIELDTYLLKTKDFETKEEAETYLRETFKDTTNLVILYQGKSYYRYLIHWDYLYDEGFYYKWTPSDKGGKGAMECYCFITFDQDLYDKESEEEWEAIKDGYNI